MSNERKVLSRGMDLAALRKTTTVKDVPGLGCDVILREMSAAQFQDTRRELAEQLAVSIIDEQGETVFQSAAELLAMPLQAWNVLVEAFVELNGATKGAVDTVSKNSEASPNADSRTA